MDYLSKYLNQPFKLGKVDVMMGILQMSNLGLIC